MIGYFHVAVLQDRQQIPIRLAFVDFPYGKAANLVGVVACLAAAQRRENSLLLNHHRAFLPTNFVCVTRKYAELEKVLARKQNGGYTRLKRINRIFLRSLLFTAF